MAGPRIEQSVSVSKVYSSPVSVLSLDNGTFLGKSLPDFFFFSPSLLVTTRPSELVWLSILKQNAIFLPNPCHSSVDNNEDCALMRLDEVQF